MIFIDPIPRCVYISYICIHIPWVKYHFLLFINDTATDTQFHLDHWSLNIHTKPRSVRPTALLVSVVCKVLFAFTYFNNNNKNDVFVDQWMIQICFTWSIVKTDDQSILTSVWNDNQNRIVENSSMLNAAGKEKYTVK